MKSKQSKLEQEINKHKENLKIRSIVLEIKEELSNLECSGIIPKIVNKELFEDPDNVMQIKLLSTLKNLKMFITKIDVSNSNNKPIHLGTNSTIMNHQNFIP